MTTLSGWQTAKTYADGSTLDVKFEDGKPVMVCTVDTEDSPAMDAKEIQNDIQDVFGFWVHLGEWQSAEEGNAIAALSIDEDQ